MIRHLCVVDGFAPKVLKTAIARRGVALNCCDYFPPLLRFGERAGARGFRLTHVPRPLSWHMLFAGVIAPTAATPGGIFVMAKINCPKCLTLFPVGDDERGVEVRCPKCQVLLRLRGKPSAAEKPDPPARSAKPDPSPRPARPKPPPPDEDDPVEDAPVVRKRRRRKKRRREAESSGLPEWIIPLVIFVLAVAMNAIIARRAGDDVGKGLVVFSLIQLVVTVPATIAGMFVAAAAMGVNFGNVFTAALQKVASITAVVQCIYTFGMTRGDDGSGMIVILFALPVYYGMFCWLFEWASRRRCGRRSSSGWSSGS